MAYEKQTWECGDAITAGKLNHMEQGIEDVGNDLPSYKVSFYVEPSDQGTILCDKTFDEIVEAFEQGKLVWGTFDKTRGSGTAWTILFLQFYRSYSGSAGLNFTGVWGNGAYLEISRIWFDGETNVISYANYSVT